MSQARSAIAHLRTTGSVQEACEVLLGLRESGGGPTSQRTEEWFAQNQDDLNQAILFIKDKLPQASVSWEEHSNGSQSGYKLSISGEFGDHDIASLGGGRQALYPLTNPPANLGR
jgi:hypothetical protein